MEGELVVDRLAAGGSGIAREPSGRVVFVEGGLPGERVRVEIVSAKRDFAQARIIEVVEASDARAEPPCPNVARGCGGCDWQHVRAHAHLELKRGIVLDALRRTARMPEIPVDVGPPLTDGRRTTARFAVDADGRLGFRERRGRAVVPLRECPVLHPALDAVLAGGASARGASELVVRVSQATGERAVAWHAEPGRRVAIEGLPPDAAIGWDAAITEVVAGRRMRLSMRSFAQASPGAAEAISAAVREALGPIPRGARVVDAYGGAGLLGLTAVDPTHPLVVVEGNAAACADAAVNLAGRDGSTEVVNTDVEAWSPAPADAVIADPARRGLGRRASEVLLGTGAGVVVLVSCDPVSFARDARLLADAGVCLETAVVLDPFPFTSHMEVVGRFVRT